MKKTGFYCVSTYAFSGHDYQGVVEFRNAYGELPAAQIAKLPFYGGLTIVYAVFGVLVLFLLGLQNDLLIFFIASGLSFTFKTDTISVCSLSSQHQNWSNCMIVPVQNYITAILIFLVVEEAMTWGFYGTFLYNHSIGH